MSLHRSLILFPLLVLMLPLRPLLVFPRLPLLVFFTNNLHTPSASILSVSSVGNEFSEDSPGKTLYESNCVRCHGRKGNRGFFGAKNLQLSTLNDRELLIRISDGRGIMPAWKKSLTSEEIDLIKEYVKTLRSLSDK